MSEMVMEPPSQQDDELNPAKAGKEPGEGGEITRAAYEETNVKHCHSCEDQPYEPLRLPRRSAQDHRARKQIDHQPRWRVREDRRRHRRAEHDSPDTRFRAAKHQR
jgi:hypothetical protein